MNIYIQVWRDKLDRKLCTELVAENWHDAMGQLLAYFDYNRFEYIHTQCVVDGKLTLQDWEDAIREAADAYNYGEFTDLGELEKHCRQIVTLDEEEHWQQYRRRMYDDTKFSTNHF